MGKRKGSLKYKQYLSWYQFWNSKMAKSINNSLMLVYSLKIISSSSATMEFMFIHVNIWMATYSEVYISKSLFSTKNLTITMVTTSFQF